MFRHRTHLVGLAYVSNKRRGDPSLGKEGIYHPIELAVVASHEQKREHRG